MFLKCELIGACGSVVSNAGFDKPCLAYFKFSRGDCECYSAWCCWFCCDLSAHSIIILVYMHRNVLFSLYLIANVRAQNLWRCCCLRLVFISVLMPCSIVNVYSIANLVARKLGVNSWQLLHDRFRLLVSSRCYILNILWNCWALYKIVGI